MNLKYAARAVPVAAALGLTLFAACTTDTPVTPGPGPGADASTGSDSSSSSDAGGGSDGSTQDTGSSADTGADTSVFICSNVDAGAACNAVVQAGTDNPVVAVGTPIPTGTGGTIVNGRYVLTDLRAYAGSLLTGVTVKSTLELCSGVAQLVGDEPGQPQYRKTFTYAPAGTAINLSDPTCSTQQPEPNIKYSSYTATPTTLTLYSTQFIFSGTYTKQ